MTASTKMTPPPDWPADSIARACESNASLSGELVSLAGLAARYVADETRFEGPLKGGGTPAQSWPAQNWMTSGSALARQTATDAWGAARDSLAIRADLPAGGVEAALRRLLDCSRDVGTEDRHGGMFAYAPTGALPASALAAFVCASINPGLTWMPTSPQFAALERCVLDWVAGSILHWPGGNGGVFTSGGSVANTLALHVARQTIARRAAVAPHEVLFFVPDHVHYCIPKGLALLGVGRDSIVSIGCNSEGTLDVHALESELNRRGADDRVLAGVVVAVGGETNTGSIDDLRGLAALCRGKAGLWLHVDACFGGFFGLTARGGEALRGIEHADSVALDPHKALQVPYGVGMLMVRDESHLQRAFRMSGAYVPPARAGRYEVANIADLGIELTREARAAQVWLPLTAYGPEAFAKHLDWCLDAIEWLANAIVDAGEFELVSGPGLSTLNFRLKRTFDGISRKDAVYSLVDDINARGRVLLAPTEIFGEACVRVCILSARSSPQNLGELVADVKQAGAAVGASLGRLETSLRNTDRSLGFRVPYRVRPIPSKGLGVTAIEDIEKGRLLWEFEEGACVPVSAEMVHTLARQSGSQAASDLLNHCFCWDGSILYPQGDTQFLNHSSQPNMASPDAVRWFATRAILEGEELLDDYGTYEKNAVYEQLCREYHAESSTKVAEIYRS
jgi:aromatic-L-amino-acid decarboxylase